MNRFILFLKKQPAGRLITLGFATVILFGTLLLLLPVSVRPEATVSFIDALFTSTSAVCVTGLIAIDTYDHFTPFGQGVVAFLVQIGGLGVTSVGVGLILAVGKHIGFKGRVLAQEGLNVTGVKGIIRLVKSVLVMTLCFEITGAVLSFLVFVRDYPLPRAIGTSIFHSIAAFNNSGFDILGGLQNLIPYQDNILLNLTTSGLIIFGGLGFLVILDILKKRSFKKLTLHSKVVITTSIVLLIAGTLLLKATEDISWLGAFFHSVSARTAGFSTYAIGDFTNAGLFVLIMLMFIGASPGSTGGGIKTSTFFVLLQGIKSSATNTTEKAFKYTVPANAFRKAAVITLMALGVVLTGTYIMVAVEPDIRLIDALFEVTSAFGTVGLSTGITPGLSDISKLLSILIMYIGRLGPLNIATLWYFDKGERARYPEGNIAIG